MNFSQIKTKVADYLNRSDLSAIIPTFIQLAQKRLERDHNFKCMEYRLETSTSDYYITMPTRYKESKWFKVIIDGEYRPLTKKSSEEALNLYPDLTNDTGDPCIYAVLSSQSEFVVRPTPDESLDYEGVFYCYTADLSGDSDTNWWTDNAWEILMYGALLEASPYLKEDERINTWAEFYKAAVKALIKADKDDELNSFESDNTYPTYA